MPSSRGSSQPRDWNQVPHIAGGFFTTWDTRKAQEYWSRQPVSFPGNLPDAGIKPRSALQADSSPPERPGKPYSHPIRHQRREGLPGWGDSASPPGGTLRLQSNGAVGGAGRSVCGSGSITSDSFFNLMDCSPSDSSVHGILQARRVGQHSLPQEIFPTQGSDAGLPTLQVDSLSSEPPGGPPQITRGNT